MFRERILTLVTSDVASRLDAILAPRYAFAKQNCNGPPNPVGRVAGPELDGRGLELISSRLLQLRAIQAKLGWVTGI